MKNYFLIIVLSIVFVSCGKEEVTAPAPKAELIAVNSLSDFEKTIQSGVTLALFHATWCSICSSQKPNVLGLLGLSSIGKVNFIEIDKDKNKEILAKYPVIGQPVTIIYKNNVEKERLVGVHTTEHMKELLIKWK